MTTVSDSEARSPTGFDHSEFSRGLNEPVAE